MINIAENKIINNNISEIISNIDILHFDEEPILFSGTNCFGNLILASSVDEDDILKTQQFFHVIIDIKTYYEFLNFKISYFEILKKNNIIFIVNKSFDNTSVITSIVNFDEIPPDYLPLENSFCPKISYSNSFNYDFILHGEKADRNLVSVDKLSNVQELMSNLFKVPFNILKKVLSTDADVYINAFTDYSAYATGSFKIRFLVKPLIKEDKRNLFTPEHDFAPLLYNYINYSMLELPNEVESIFKNPDKSSPKLDRLINDLKSFVQKSGYSEDSFSEETARKDIIESAEKVLDVAETIGECYTSIELKNNNTSLCLIDSTFKESIQKTCKIIEENNPEFTIDKTPAEYKVIIYHLNLKSRKGNAYFVEGSKVYSPRIFISGNKPLETTEFTKSMHENLQIKVTALAKKINGVIRHLNIIYEP